MVTGSRGVGKSTLCGRIAEVARDAGLRVAGVLTERESVLPRSEQPGNGPGGDRYLMDLSTGERTRFTRANADGEAVADPLTPGFRFDPGVFERGGRPIVVTVTEENRVDLGDVLSRDVC